MRELLVRLRAALRYGIPATTGESAIFRIGRWQVDIDKRGVADASGERLHLTPLEYRILEILRSHAGMMVTDRQLLVQAWGPGHAEQTPYLRRYMKQLRGKLEDDPVRPRHLLAEAGAGYRLVVDEWR